MNARFLFVAFAAVLLMAIWEFTHRPISHPPGVLVPSVPQQDAVDASSINLVKPGFAIKPLARFSISARVLSRADYRWDREAALVPTDLALGWGRMSDSAVLQKIEISQSVRFFQWRVREFPIPEREIIESSANMHLIPADNIVEHEIERTRVGDIVSFDGYLVEADWPNGAKWVSSLTRSDTGAGACELVWVEHFDIAKAH